MAYCKVIPPKAPAGIGNKLFPWARCRVFSHLTGVPMLAPRWSQLALGCLLRGKPRSYLDVFASEKTEIKGLKRLWIERLSKKRSEPQDWSRNESKLYNALYVFEGEKDFFARLHPWRDFLYQEFLSIVCEKYRVEAANLPRSPIALHVRLGDFRVAKNAEEYIMSGGLRTPLEWFSRTLKSIRGRVGEDVPAHLFSDGSDSDLKELLALNKVRRIPTKNAITDLLALSQSQVLLASGGSTFSAWAAFFGKMPVVTIPGQSLDWYKLNRTPDCYRGVFDPAKPDLAFLTQAAAVLKKDFSLPDYPLQATSIP